jgi:hypothetical protein
MIKEQLQAALLDICNLKLQKSDTKTKVFACDISAALAICVDIVLGMLVHALFK